MAAAASAVGVRLLDQFSVSPPKGSVPDTSLPLTFFDLLWLYGGPVERLFFYPFPHSTAHFIDNLLPGLKSSLSLTLQHFFPLAGHVRLSPGSDDHYEIHYADGDSVSLTLAESDGDFEELSGSHARDLAGLQALVPRLTNSHEPQALLALQVTLFPNHGVSLGVAAHHVAGDGASSMHFLKSWAAACRSGGSSSIVSPQPVHDRTLIADPSGLYSIFMNDIRRFGLNRPQGVFAADKQQEAVYHATFTLRREHVERLKQRVLAKAVEGKAPFHCSTFVVACAYVWVCLERTRRECMGDKNVAYFGCAVDCRRRLEPRVPQAYFGNCLGVSLSEAKAADLTGEDGFVVASEAIGRGIEKLGEGALKGAEGWFPLFITLMAHKPLSVAGSPRLRVYDTDFGWGKPAKVEVISITHSGAISLAENREEEGGLEIGLAVTRAELDGFGSHFSSGLELLQECP